MTTFTIVVTGSRHWTNEEQIKEFMGTLIYGMKASGVEEVVVVHGGARGVDQIAAQWSEYYGAKVIPENAEWNTKGWYDPGAGLERNILMLEKYSPDLVVAFRAPGKSSGTDHCVTEAHKRKIKVETEHENSGEHESS